MLKKIGHFFEAHVEKIVLIVIGIICAWLFITKVMFSPNAVEFQGAMTGPGQIDEKILEEAIKLRDKTRGVNAQSVTRLAQKSEFLARLENPVNYMNLEFSPIVPELPKKTDGPRHIYANPYINPATNVKVELISAAAYEPVVEIGRENSYTKDNCEPNNVDLVTIEAEFDIGALTNEFYECYVDDVDEDSADYELSVPKFSSINVQRQELNENGLWSQWQDVPRTKIDKYRNTIKVVKSAADLPMGGLYIYKILLDNPEIQLEILQPQPYQIASAYDEWMPPTLHDEYVDAVDEEQRAARLEERANNNNTRSQDTGRRGRSNTGGVNSLNTGGVGTTRGGRRRTLGGVDDTDNTRNLYDEEETPLEKVYIDFEETILTYEDDLTRMDEPILIWAYDDTAKPGKTYRYRLRVGVLNPVAEDDGDDIVFWSDFSDTTDVVNVPRRIYFFPQRVQAAAETVTVSVYKLVLGYWYQNIFNVAKGEMIGQKVALDIDPDDEDRLTDEPEIIDYTTGAILVDYKPSTELSAASSSGSRQYYDMLYSYDGIDIKHIPITTRYNELPMELRDAYTELQRKVKVDREPLRDWGSSEIDVEDIRNGQMRGRSFRRTLSSQ